MMTMVKALIQNKVVYGVAVLLALILGGWSIVYRDFLFRWQAVGFVWIIPARSGIGKYIGSHGKSFVADADVP